MLWHGKWSLTEQFTTHNSSHKEACHKCMSHARIVQLHRGKTLLAQFSKTVTQRTSIRHLSASVLLYPMYKEPVKCFFCSPCTICLTVSNQKVDNQFDNSIPLCICIVNHQHLSDSVSMLCFLMTHTHCCTKKDLPLSQNVLKYCHVAFSAFQGLFTL